MSEEEPKSTPYTGSAHEVVDEWSREIFGALSSWPVANGGEWTRWKPRYLALKIDEANGQEIEPIIIDTSDQVVTVEFGYWEERIPEPGTGGADAAETAAQAMQLVEQWLAGAIRTAVYWNAIGEWCGTIVIKADDLASQLAYGAQRLRDLNPARVEVRSPARHDWQSITVDADWLTPPALSPNRMPN